MERKDRDRDLDKVKVTFMCTGAPNSSPYRGKRVRARTSVLRVSSIEQKNLTQGRYRSTSSLLVCTRSCFPTIAEISM